MNWIWIFFNECQILCIEPSENDKERVSDKLLEIMKEANEIWEQLFDLMCKIDSVRYKSNNKLYQHISEKNL